jgi:hypothetical protein
LGEFAWRTSAILVVEVHEHLAYELSALQAKPVEKRTLKVARLWNWNGITVKAHTRSEARAAFKRQLGVKRLPPRTNVVAVAA